MIISNVYTSRLTINYTLLSSRSLGTGVANERG